MTNVRRLDAGTLELGGGLEVLVAAALEGVPPGGELEVGLRSRSVALELPAWARIAGHEVTGEGAEGALFLVRLRRGAGARVLGAAAPARAEPLPDGDGTLPMQRVRDAVGEAAADAPPAAGLVPLGALAEPGGPGAAGPGDP
jgi:hypothetical protein